MIIVAGLVLIAVAIAVLARAYAGDQHQRQPSTADPVPEMSAASATDDDEELVRHSLRPWVLRGIDDVQAKQWIDRGFDVDHAYLLMSMDIDPRTAGRLRDAGLDDAALLTLVEEASFRQQTAHEQLVTLAERAPDLAPQAVAWIAAGIEGDRALAYAEAGLTMAIAHEWTAAGWNIDDALPWFRARFEPATARAWRASGFEAHEAGAWKAEHFGIKQAAEWRRLGDTPALARDVEQRFAAERITVADGLAWLDRGFSVDEICAGWPQMARGNDAGPWRAAWKGLTLSPDEVANWHTKFDQRSAEQWLEAGVRDPNAALRLHRRGLAPSDVHKVANRFAEAFDQVPVTRDDLLSAAGQLARAGGSPQLRARLDKAARSEGASQPREVSADLIDDVLDELRMLDDAGSLGAPHAARALARRLEQGLIVSALITGRNERLQAGTPSN